MALFGSIGKALGLGTTQQFVTAATGSPIAGKLAGAASERVSGAFRQAVAAPVGQQQGQAVAVDIPDTTPMETAISGESGGYGMPGIQPAVFRAPSAPAMDMGITPAGLPAVIGGGTAVMAGGRTLLNALGIIGGAAALAPIIIDPLTGEEKKLRVTKRLKSQVRKAVEMLGIEATANAMGTSVDVVVYILTKKMRNDGPYVTKAAVRKTRATVRKMKNLCDMYDDLRPAAKRRAPARASSRTRVVNVK